MKKQALYRNLARYYDLVYNWKDYKKEVNKINELITKFKKSKGKELLEVACGTGNHLEYFRKFFSCTGTDINQGILNVAKNKIKKVNFKKANMVNMNLKKKFDVITCLFSSIGYVKTYSNLQKTLKNFERHLKKGGVVIIEPWFTKSTYKVGSNHLSTYEDENIKIARLVVSKIKDNISEMDMHFLIAERNKEVKHLTERHEMGLFEIDKTLQFMKKAGFKTIFLKNGLMKDRGLFIGIKE
jgi:ubiquinone/menaquinone biosynthesis C-methylase UbiE